VSAGIEQNGMPLGKHKRVYIYHGVPDYRSIISLEASGDKVERLPNIWDEQGRTLVMGKIPDFPRGICADRPG
jgi:hypothetical protein